MLNVPIAIRTCNRPVFLDLTLRSLFASDLPNGQSVVVIDDCSNEEIAKKYLFTDDEIELATPYQWPNNSAQWKNHVGYMKEVSKMKGIKSRIEVMQPKTKKGVKGHIFWCIDQMFMRFVNSQEIIIIEADVIFHKDWYNAVMNAYGKCKIGKGPNGNKLGLLTCYDRKGKRIVNDYSWAWRSVRKQGNRWNCGNGIGGCMYLVTRMFYEASNSDFKKSYNPAQRAGDTQLQACCGNSQCNIAVTVPSLIQHVGVQSLAWPKKGWRHCVNFLKPYCLLDNLDNVKLIGN